MILLCIQWNFNRENSAYKIFREQSMDRSDIGGRTSDCRASAAVKSVQENLPRNLHKNFCKKLLTMSNERCILHASKDSDASEPVPGNVSFTNLQAFESGQVMRGTHLQRVRGS